MREELHRYLDGELDREELPEDLRQEAGAWDRLLTTFRSEAGRTAPPRLESRVFQELGGARKERAWRRVWDWMVRPRTVRVSPAVGAAVAALLAVAWLRPWSGPETGGTGVPGGPTPSAERAAPGPSAAASADRAARGPSQPPAELVSVQFSLQAPGASTVHVAGDFSNWEPVARLQDPDGDGVWTGRVTLRPGVHEYMFVVNGTRWVTDPRAERYADDGFGHRNAVLALGTGGRNGLD